MKIFIIPILFGNNMDTLFGVKNDVFIIYNLFYKYYLKRPDKWNKPYIFLNEESSLTNIKDIIINNLIEAKSKVRRINSLIGFFIVSFLEFKFKFEICR